MSLASWQDAKEQVRQATNIVELVGSYMPLRPQGQNYVGLCPWHDDARPSLQVNPARQSWKCWVCDLGGDAFSFVMQREQVEFRDALTMLADRAGIELTQTARTRPGDPNDKKTLFEAVRWAADLFRDCLEKSPDAAPARDYFEQRGINQESRDRFRLGFSPNQWQWLADRAHGSTFTPPVLEAAGLLGRSAKSNRHYDRFKGRIIFPISDSQGRAIGFGGRILPALSEGSPAKYVNSPETRLFSKGEHVYGLDVARDAISKARRVVVVEGYTDVIMAHQFGLGNFVAVLGTALGPKHVQLLRRYADSVTLVLDGDEAGQRRTNEVLELFIASEVDLRILTLPDGMDPCDYVLTRGTDAMRSALDSASDALSHAVRIKTDGVDILRDTHRANLALEQILQVIAKAPRYSSGTSSSRVLRERQTLTRLAREFQLDEGTVRQRLSELRKTAGEGGSRPPHVPGDQPKPVLQALCVELLGILALHPELVELALSEISPDELPDAEARSILLTYRQVMDAGVAPEFFTIMTTTEDPSLKNLLVGIDEQAAEKEPLAHEDATARLRCVIDELQHRADVTQRRKTMAALEKQLYSSEEELGVLNELLERERKRQGIPAPTDG